jgi:hypothetical protein
VFTPKESDMRVTGSFILLFAMALCASARPMAADAVIRGLVTGAGGKPIAGALVKATAADSIQSISRYTGADGRYELAVPAGRYNVVASAHAFRSGAQPRDAAAEGALDFSLTPDWGVQHFTGADVDALIPDQPAAALLKSMCINCHALDVMLRRRGSTAAQWRAYVETPMAQRIGRGKFNASEAEWKVLTSELERWFGPKGQYFGPDAEPPTREQVQRPPVAPAVARATFREYTDCRTRAACRTA